MIEPAILGVATAVPTHQYEQMELYDKFMAHIFNNRRAPAIFRATEIDTRYSVLPDPGWLAVNPGAEERNNVYMKEAPDLAVKAIQAALDKANLTLDDVDDLIVVSCTGFDTPGLDVLVAEKMNMSPLRRTAIVGMGCHGLMPGLYRATTAVQARPNTKTLILTLELCTLHLQHDNNIRNILGSALFGDGASAAIVGHDPAADSLAGAAPRIIDSLTYSNYQTQKEMSFHPGDHGYRIHLSTKIPKIIRVQLPDLVAKLLHRNQLQLSDLKHWIVHPGGAKILDYLEDVMELDQHELQHARAILREYGNMSSATLLFVMDRLMQVDKPQPGDFGLMIGFGPGITLELCLVQW
jgi:alkylresorcinol/alkylpyrone synthase